MKLEENASFVGVRALIGYVGDPFGPVSYALGQVKRGHGDQGNTERLVLPLVNNGFESLSTQQRDMTK